MVDSSETVEEFSVAKAVLVWLIASVVNKVAVSSAVGMISFLFMNTEYSRAAEPPVQCGVSHLSRRTEPHCL